MEDEKIVGMYWERDESAIEESDKKYGRYCHSIAYNILYSDEDSKECVNDTWLGAWNSIPPEKPTLLKSFLGRITRNIALNRIDYNNALKRGVPVCEITEEFSECMPEKRLSLEDEVALKGAINGFLATLDTRTRIIFMRRYWYICTVSDIAESMGMSENHVSVILHRTRIKFREYLGKEGINI